MNETRLLISSAKLAGEVGFEPTFTGPEPAVLPLDYSPKTDVTESKSRRFFGGVDGILPLIFPQKSSEIGQLIQSQLSSSPPCNESLPQPVLKYQPAVVDGAGILLAPSSRAVHNEDTDDANETIPRAATPTLRAFTTRSADETEVMMAPSTLPESVTEVVPC